MRIITLLLTFLLLLPLSGCGFASYDPGSVSFCTALAVEPMGEGILLTVETISAAEDEAPNALYLSAAAPTVSAALTLLSDSHPGRLQPQTARLLLLSADFDRAALDAVTAQLMADELLSLRCYVCVASSPTTLLGTQLPTAVSEPCGAYLCRLFDESSDPPLPLLSLFRATAEGTPLPLPVAAIGPSGLPVTLGLSLPRS